MCLGARARACLVCERWLTCGTAHASDGSGAYLCVYCFLICPHSVVVAVLLQWLLLLICEEAAHALIFFDVEFGGGGWVHTLQIYFAYKMKTYSIWTYYNNRHAFHLVVRTAIICTTHNMLEIGAKGYVSISSGKMWKTTIGFCSGLHSNTVRRVWIAEWIIFLVR